MQLFQPEEFRKGQKETPDILPPPQILLDGIYFDWAMHALSGRTKSQKDWPDNPETNPITIKPKAVSHMAEQSWVPLPFCSPPRRPFTIKSLPLSACVSPQTIHFQALDKSPLAGSGRSPHSCNKTGTHFSTKATNMGWYSRYLCHFIHTPCHP